MPRMVRAVRRCPPPPGALRAGETARVAVLTPGVPGRAYRTYRWGINQDLWQRVWLKSLDLEENPMPQTVSGSSVCAPRRSRSPCRSPNCLPDPPSWNGEYAITFIVGPKSGTSMAAGQPEVQYTDTYTFRSSCTSTATIISGPRRGTRRFRNRFNSPGMGRPGRKSTISNGTA